MRIESVNAASRIYEAVNLSSSKTKKASENTGDKFEISQAAKDYQIAKAAVKNAPDIRAEKVASIKAKIEDGTYNVSAEAVADKILNSVNTLTF